MEGATVKGHVICGFQPHLGTPADSLSVYLINQPSVKLSLLGQQRCAI
jgi:hypothetical protein